MYDTLLFDLDGTLTDPKEGITKCVQYALKSFQIDEENRDRLVCFIGPPLHESFRVYYGFDKDQANRAVQKYRERFETIGLYENRVFDGIKEMLQQLEASGKCLAVATSKPEIFAKKILEKYELLTYFKEVVGSEMDGTRTEKSEVIQEVFKRLGLSEEQKQRVLMIGDRKHDILGAKKCGIHSMGVQFGYAEPNELVVAGADYIVNTVEELAIFLSK